MESKVNKKINYLAVIPLWGSIIILVWLFIKSIQKKSNPKVFLRFLFGCGMIGFLSILSIALLLNLINRMVDISAFMHTYGFIISVVIGGYLLNLFTFLKISKVWNDL